MANFQVSLRDIDDVLQVAFSGGNTIITITDTSNYDEIGPEDGHARNNFSSWRKVVITFPDSSTYEFETTQPFPNYVEPPIGSNDVIVYDHEDQLVDGVYTADLYSVPTYTNGFNYDADDDCVVIVTANVPAFYKCIQNASSELITDTDYWTPITEAELPAKYHVSGRFMNRFNLDACVCDAVKAAYEESKETICDDRQMVTSKKFNKMNRVLMAQFTLDCLIEEENFDSMVILFNFTKNICGCDCGC